MNTINTVTGQITPAMLGKTLMHEHIISSAAGIPENYPNLYRKDAEDVILTDLADMKAHGIATVVDANCFDLGRDVKTMKKMSEMSGVQIIACSGFFMEPFPMLGDFTAKDFAEGFIHEILNGVGDTGIKPGILKTAMDTEGPTRGREVIHRAVGIASKELGFPVMLHSCPEKEVGRWQLKFLKEEGADLHRVKVDHCLETNDLEYLKWLCEQGVWLGVDRLPRVCNEEESRKFPSIPDRVKMIKRMLDAGLGERMLFSHDFMCTSTFFDHQESEEDQKFISGMNPQRFGFLQDSIFSQLEELGVDREMLEKMLEENPKRFFEGC